MKRAYAVILGILLGAVAAGISVGVFLKLANDDRAHLADQLSSTILNANASREESQRAIEEANRKLTQANTEISKAQELVAALQEERALLATAAPLPTVSTRTLRDWKDVVALPLGVSMKYPADSAVLQNTPQELTLTKTAASEDARWFSLIPYSDRVESEILSAFTSSTPVSYVVQGHLLTGRKGTILGQRGTIFVLRVRSNAVTTHLLWIRDSATSGTALNVLSTLRFES